MTPRPVAVDRVLAPFREFAATSASSGLLLMAAAVVALIWANSPLADSYQELWSTPVSIRVGAFVFEETLLHWVNDGLMVIFFLVVGLEIRREFVAGELASRRRATLPIAAAIGGAVLPALIFLLVVRDPGGQRGWGVPMATDIAFALGVLALLGSRAPLGLRIFITALAIVDDLLAVLVIAVFYTSDLSIPALAAAGVVLGVLVVANRIGVRAPLVYVVLGIALWLAVFESGVHATVAGVLLAMTIPSSTRFDSAAYVAEAREHIGDFEDRTTGGEDASTERHHAALWQLEAATERAQAPMLRFEHSLHPWVAFLIVPIFALANAGVRLGDELGALLFDPIAVGIVLGLVIGKQVGITLVSAVVVKLGLASLPDGVTWRDIYGAAWLGGIGFTMSLFIAGLAYGEGSVELDRAKVGILAASVIAGVGGYLVLRLIAARSNR
ncbi:MAG TPA: Na+/H+ antiporter NhaA [Candidatus Limnocylindrales bacterium]|nr:Na+/H+ antiporter NhaA [Candidatus Limnocylindrales bacterium]